MLGVDAHRRVAVHEHPDHTRERARHGQLARAQQRDAAQPHAARRHGRVVGGQRGEREIPANEFFLEYRKTALAPDELILQVRYPLPAGRQLRFRKVGTRRAQAISKVVMAVVGGERPRIAVGSVGPTVIRCTKTEAALAGGATFEEAQPVLRAVTENVLLEIQKTFDFFKATASTDQISRIMLSGGASRVEGFAETLQERFSTPVEMFDPFRKVTLDAKKFSADVRDSIAPTAAVAVGLAVRRAGDR